MFRTTNIRILVFLCGIISLLSSCDTRRGVDREAAKKEMEAHKIKRITESELMAKGDEIGRKVQEETQKVFQEALMNAIKENGITGAVDYCNLNANELVKKFEDSLDVEIMRVTDRPRNPKDTLSPFELEVFEAYKYAPENASAQVQELDAKTLIFNKPILITDGLCLNCHGKVGSAVSHEDYQLIRSLYPDDQAIGYEMGELRGMWSIKIPKKTVVDQL